MNTKKIVPGFFAIAICILSTAFSASAAWQIEPVPCSKTPGFATIKLDSNDFPHIALKGYDASSAEYLLYAHKDVSGWQEETVRGYDVSYDVFLPVIEVDTLGYPHIFNGLSRFVGGGIGVAHYYTISRKDASGWHSSTLSDQAFNTSYYGLPYSFSLDTNDVEHSFRQSYSGMFDTAIYYDAERVVSTDPVSNRLASDLAMDSGNYPHACYRESINLPLTYLYKDSAGWHSETVDVEGNTADYLSLGLDSYDRAHVSYYDNVNKDLKYAYRDESGWHLETVESTGNVGMYNSIGIDSLDTPHISYYDDTNGDLKYARRDAAGWQIETVDSTGDVGRYSSLDIDSLDRPHILYLDSTNIALKYAVSPLDCHEDADCPEGFECVEGVCEQIPDNPPAFGSGPFLAAGTWPVLPTSQESPMYLDANYEVLWTFSDDYGSCSEACTHIAEYQAAGDESWTALAVTATANGYAYVTLPIESLQNATTYAFRYSVTDCASQTTQSAVYYFRVAITDAPPVITAGPYLAAGPWPVLPTSSARALVLDQNEYVLWTFSDDYAFCSGLCTHRARYRKVGDTAWTWIPVSADPTGKKYAYAELPVESLDAGTYQFYFDVRDCAGQRTYAAKVYYFKVE